MSVEPVGLLGGAFDPVHRGHIEMARQCVETLHLKTVKFIPANIPPHKPAPRAGGRRRLAMLDRALKPFPEFMVEETELQRGGVSYTIETLEHLRVQNPVQPVCFIMGMDAFATLTTWRRWGELTDHAHLILMDRKGQGPLNLDHPMQEFYDEHACRSVADIHDHPHGYVYKTAIAIREVSSSQIRALLKNGGETEQLLPGEVYRYIRENNLYV